VSDDPFGGYTITHILDCLADPRKVRVIAEADREVGDVFPYLNAILPNVAYSPGANTLTLKRAYRLITLYPHVAVMAKVDGEEDALDVLDWLRELINDTYHRRDEIVPCYEQRRLVGFLEVYLLLPGGNCKACGEATCLAFSVGLVESRHRLGDCPRLDEAHQQRLTSLLGQAAPPDE
jgi:ArsR family metal-binding transcriptional regulator